MSERPPGCNIMICDAMVHRYVSPMRAEMVYRLVHHQGVPQSEVARRLGISRAAISQYISKKRGGSEIDLSGELDQMINRWALAVMGEDDAITVCDVCRCSKTGKCPFSSDQNLE